MSCPIDHEKVLIHRYSSSHSKIFRSFQLSSIVSLPTFGKQKIDCANGTLEDSEEYSSQILALSCELDQLRLIPKELLQRNS